MTAYQIADLVSTLLLVVLVGFWVWYSREQLKVAKRAEQEREDGRRAIGMMASFGRSQLD